MSNTRMKLLPSEPKGIVLMQIAALIQKEPLETYRFINLKYGDAVFCNWPTKPCLFLYHPKSVEYVLKTNHVNYIKSEEYEDLKPLLGEGLLTSEGAHWRQMRKIMAKEFSTTRIQEFLPIIDRQTKDCFIKIQERLDSNISEFTDATDIDRIFMKLTLNLACQLFFGIPAKDSSEIGDVIEFETRRIAKRSKAVINIPYFVPTPTNLRSKILISQIDKMVEDIIKQGSCEVNILSRLLTNGTDLETKKIRDEVVTLMLAGHETTSNALSWAVYCLTQNSQWIEKIRIELQKTKPKTADDLLQCEILKSVFLESLRLFPPVPLISRTALEDDEIDGLKTKKGVTIAISPYVIHRNSEHWNQPDLFRPERFINRTMKANDFTYIPFSKGPRACIGEQLAMVQGLSILANFITHFDFELFSGFLPQPEHHVTLRSVNGMKIVLTKIKGK